MFRKKKENEKKKILWDAVRILKNILCYAHKFRKETHR